MLRRLLPCFLVFLLLVPTLTSQSVWWDEGISLHLAGLPWNAIVADRAANIHPPLYFLLLSIWSALAGRTPFAARFLSALITTLLPAVVYRFLGRRLGPRSGRAGALLVALAPPFLIYGQEARAYALLLLWVMALWSLIWLPHGDRQEGARTAVWRGALLGIVQVGLVLSHYQGAIAVGVAGSWLLVQEVRRVRGRAKRHAMVEWLVSLAVSALVAFPWILTMQRVGLEGLRRQAGLDNAATAAPADYVLGLIGMFHTVGLPAALADPALLRPSALAGLFLAGGTLLALAGAGSRRAVLPLLGLWCLPLLSVPFIWIMSPQSHPRYIYPFVLGGWLLSGALVGSCLRRGRSAGRAARLVWGGGLLAALLVTSVLGVSAYLTNPVYARTDIRGVAAYVAAEAESGDLVIVPDTDWSLAQYNVGAARVVMAGASRGGPYVLPIDGAAPRRVFALDYGRGALDRGGGLRATLTWNGALVERHAFRGVLLEVYELAGETSVPGVPGLTPCSPLPRQCVNGTGPCLVGAAYPVHPVSGAALPVRLCWEGEGTANAYGIAFRLVAPSGAVVAAHDTLLLDERARTVLAWDAAGTSSYHVMPLPVGLLPQAYNVQVGVFDFDAPGVGVNFVDQAGVPHPAVPLGSVEPLGVPWREESLYGITPSAVTPHPLSTQSLSIEGAAIDRSRVRPGDRLYVTIVGRAAGGDSEHPGLIVGLRRDGVWMVTQAVDAIAEHLPPGRPVSIPIALFVPAAAESGPVEVVLQAGSSEAVVGEVHVEGGEHRYDVPLIAYPGDAVAMDVATLAGFEPVPDPVVVAGEPFTLTLVWRAAAGLSDSAWAASDLKVFVHLVIGDALVAQHDGVPANWTRPTAGWVPEEIVVDAHTLVWQRLDLGGDAVLRVGFYDAVTGERVRWENGQDALVLPLSLSVEANR